MNDVLSMLGQIEEAMAKKCPVGKNNVYSIGGGQPRIPSHFRSCASIKARKRLAFEKFSSISVEF